MPGDQQRINVPALVLLAILSGGTASVAGIRFSWVQPDDGATKQEIRELRNEFREAIKEEFSARQEADAALGKGTERIYREVIEIRELCKYLERRCTRLERGS